MLGMVEGGGALRGHEKMKESHSSVTMEVTRSMTKRVRRSMGASI